MNIYHEIATEYIEAGISIFPIKLDGSKSPAVSSWLPYQHRFATDNELRRWFNQPAGIGIVCGKGSGGIEVIDFDDSTCFEPWKAKVDPSIMSWLPVVETGALGFHVLYRCCAIAGNSKLACYEPNNGITDKLTRIETRGEGGYIVGVGSPINVHSSGNPYVQVAGPVLPMVPTITPEDRKHLWTAAESFDRAGIIRASVQSELNKIKRLEWERKQVARPANEITPWDDFDERGDLRSVLTAAGWIDLGKDRWSRPRSEGEPHTSAVVTVSATTGQEVLTVFSSNAPAAIAPQSQRESKTNGKFQVYKTLIHNGDGTAAARELSRLGYGKQEATR